MSKTKDIAFVSGSDARYFPMLIEWIHSIRSFSQGKDAAICVMDTGLTEAQRNILKDHAIHVTTPDWPCHIPDIKIRGREYLKSCVCRPFINKIFPGYDYYFWMDPDTWVQNWRGVDLFLQGAARGKIALTAQSDRAYPKGMRVKFLGHWPFKARSFYYSNAKKAFGIKTAQELFPYHQLLAGAFCLHKDAPHWDIWQDLLIEAVTSRYGKAFTAEQLTLGMMVYLEGCPAEILPAWTHWTCEHKLKWDPKNGKWVEPFLPHEEISILHLSGYDDMRVDRSVRTDFLTVDDKEISLSYRYAGYDGERAA